MDEACDPIPVLKDGMPGWIVRFATTIADGDFADIEMVDGRSKFIRLPDYGVRIKQFASAAPVVWC